MMTARDDRSLELECPRSRAELSLEEWELTEEAVQVIRDNEARGAGKPAISGKSLLRVDAGDATVNEIGGQ